MCSEVDRTHIRSNCTAAANTQDVILPESSGSVGYTLKMLAGGKF